MKNMHERLRRAREEAGIKSAAQAAARFGVSASAYRAHENGQNRFDHAAALRYARAFGVSAEWLFYGDDLSYEEWRVCQSVAGRPEADNAPSRTASCASQASADPEIDAWIQANLLARSGSGEDETTPDDEAARDRWCLPAWVLERHGLSPRHAAAFVVNGDAMAPTLSGGDIIFVDTRHRTPSPDGLYAVADRFGGVAVKRLQALSHRIRISSDNDRHAAADVAEADLKIVGRYVCRLTA